MTGIIKLVRTVSGATCINLKFATLEMRGNWAELTFAQTSGNVTRDRKKIFGSSSLLASKMANETLIERLRFTFTANGRFKLGISQNRK